MTITYREPRLSDGARIHQMVLRAGTLDVNSAYLYFLLSDHFHATCAIAETEDRLVGFLTGYRLPDAPGTLFVWQIAVDPDMRGRGVASGLLNALESRDWFRDIRRIELTISPDNSASQALFTRWAKQLDKPIQTQPYLSAELLGDGHQPEDTYWIDLDPVGLD
ncbi:diaminobutyrate acetyltransferase [Halothiobacillus diazotrophicus]|uniref:L-2,4-diaminobutyric acid acetyltransferase n=1 Tax=Halothiobacillus diazotrophicus TaxID=1860122 RepID=A0A191ZJS7_9GAMM|nr:diaminobutyrate acetyltransferase [Halothiobacillus diazotrophicus]ANJ68156.1 diaminobutyrate acetyltransferase [Halothiobacillus diazotrophicus]